MAIVDPLLWGCLWTLLGALYCWLTNKKGTLASIRVFCSEKIEIDDGQHVFGVFFFLPAMSEDVVEMFSVCLSVSLCVCLSLSVSPI